MTIKIYQKIKHKIKLILTKIWQERYDNAIKLSQDDFTTTDSH